MNYKMNNIIKILATATIVFSLAILPSAVAQQSEYGFDINGPWVDTVIISQMLEQQAAISALKTGEIDALGLPQISTVQQASLEGDPNIALMKNQPSANPYVIYINIGDGTQFHGPGATEAFRDKRFRVAFNHLINRQMIVDVVMQGVSEPIYSPMSHDIWGDFASQNVKTYPYNVTLANEMLDDAGYIDIDSDGWRETPTGQELAVDLRWFTNKPADGNVAELIASTCREKAQLNLVSFGVDAARGYTEAWVEKVFDMYLFSLTYVPGNFYTILTSGIGYSTNSYNIGRYNNTEYDYWHDKFFGTLNMTEAVEACRKCLEIAMENSHYIPVVSLPLQKAYRTDKFTNWVTDIAGPLTYTYWNYLNVRLKSGEAGGTLRASINVDVTTNNPLKQQNLFSHSVWSLAFEPLIRGGIRGHTYGPEVPGLAESWDVSPATVDGTDGQILTFNLVHNATWHDGVNITSADVKYSFEELIPKAPLFANFIEGVVKVEAPDDYTVKVYMNKTSFFSIYNVGRNPLIVPKHIWETYEDTEGFPAQMDLDPEDVIGSGPFKLTEWVRGEYVRFDKYSDYYYPAVESEEPPPGPNGSVIDWTTVGIVVVVIAVVAVAGVIVYRWKTKP